jgi:hypothetical protein
MKTVTDTERETMRIVDFRARAVIATHDQS